MHSKYLHLVGGLVSLASCGGGGQPASAPHHNPVTIAPALKAAPMRECERVATSGNHDMFQYIAIVAPSRDDILGLDLLHVQGLSLPDHPSTDMLADGRVSVGTLATDTAIATLCARGCTHDRNCDIFVITSKEQLLLRWKQLQCDVEPEPGTTRDPACNRP